MQELKKRLMEIEASERAGAIRIGALEAENTQLKERLVVSAAEIKWFKEMWQKK
jgi:predicted nuclease with TOPRIM domain